MNFSQTIMLVDEDPELRATLAHRLGKLGYRVAQAHSAEDARQVAIRETPALILVDRGLPGDGAQAQAILASLKQDPDVAHIPVLMTSARAAMLS